MCFLISTETNYCTFTQLNILKAKRVLTAEVLSHPHLRKAERPQKDDSKVKKEEHLYLNHNQRLPSSVN